MKQLKGIKKSIVLLGGDKEPTLEVFYRHDPSCFSSSFIFFNFYLQVVVSYISQNASLPPEQHVQTCSFQQSWEEQEEEKTLTAA